MIKSKEIRWAWLVARIEERSIQDFGGLKLRERNHLEVLSVDGRIILKYSRT